MKEDLLKQILDSRKQSISTPTLDEMGVNSEMLQKVYEWANSMASYGELASYIPELTKVDASKTAIVIGDLNQRIIAVGNGVDVKVSIQSVIKPFLYIYALEKGLSANQISYIEATALKFNTDAVMQPDQLKNLPGHPLNNAGAISSAGSIDCFDDFLGFMRLLTGNENLEVLLNIFESEMQTNGNNRAIAQRLYETGRFQSQQKSNIALEYYTKACAIGVTAYDITTACLVLANGGRMNGRQVIKEDNIVRAINAMNTYGLYEHTGEISLLAAGARALSCKSGVGGLIINVDPGRGAFCTYGSKLDSAGNSVFGKYALIPLNNLLAAPNGMRLSSEEIIRSLSKEQTN
ncbi:MAG: glutaminase [Bacteroidales bacterium]|nr:glutaminase [Bacteroidales bacterium]